MSRKKTGALAFFITEQLLDVAWGSDGALDYALDEGSLV